MKYLMRERYMRHGSYEIRVLPVSARSMNRERCSGCVMLLTRRPDGTCAEYLTTSHLRSHGSLKGLPPERG